MGAQMIYPFEDRYYAGMVDLIWNNAVPGGTPFDSILDSEHKQWFGDTILLPYVRHQKGNVWVAVDEDDQVIGSCFGSTGGELFDHKQHQFVMRQVGKLGVSLSFDLALSWNAWFGNDNKFYAYILAKGQKERPKRPPHRTHFHLQTAVGHRDQGVGSRLVLSFLSGVPRCEGHTYISIEAHTYLKKPLEFFTSRGYVLHDRKETKMFRDHIEGDVHINSFIIPRVKLEAYHRDKLGTMLEAKVA